MCNQRTFNKHDLIIVVEKQILVSEIKIIMDVVEYESVEKLTSFRAILKIFIINDPRNNFLSKTNEYL